MTTPARELAPVPAMLLTGALVLLAGLDGCGKGTSPAPAPPPSVDTAGMEPQVAAAIEGRLAALTDDRASATSWGELGMVLHAHELYPDAAECYRQAAALAPADYRWPYLEAMAEERDRPVEALAAFERSAALSPADAAFYTHYADALVSAGRSAEAETRYRRALELDPEASHARYGLGRLAMAAGDLATAQLELEEAARLAPRHGQVHVALAQVYFRLGDEERARREELLAAAYPEATRPRNPVLEAMEAKAVNSRSYTERGVRLAEEGRFPEAEEAFRRVLAIRPGNARDHANLGGALARQGKLEAARASYARALELTPDDPWTLNNLALALADAGDLAGATARLEEALRLDPAYAEAHHNLGLILARQGRHEEAIASYRRALERQPALVDAHTNLGTALAAQGGLEEAMAAWRQALAIDRQNLSALYNLAAALARQGEHDEAIELLREGLAHAPNSSRLASLLAWELATAPDQGLRDGRQALALARRIHQAYPDRSASADLLAAALAATGSFEEAGSAGERALALARQEAAPGDLLAQLEARLAGYRLARPYRQPPAQADR